MEINFVSDNSNTVDTSCLNITFEEENPLQLENTFPMHDEDGKALTQQAVISQLLA